MRENVTNLKPGRKLYIDIVKGVAMISIIAGHMGSPVIDGFVYTYHVPLFLLVSGLFFRNRQGIIKKRLRQLLRSYLITIMAILLADECKVVWNIFREKAGPQDLIRKAGKWIVAGLYGSGARKDLFCLQLPAVGAIWFFLALIWATAFLYWIVNCRILKNTAQQMIAVLVVFLLGMVSAKWVWLPFSIQAGMSGLLFLYLGYCTGQWEEKMHSWFVPFFFLAVWAIAIWFSYKNDCMSLARSYFPNCVINVLGAISGSYLIIRVCRKIEGWKPLSDFLILFGQKTEVVLCFHLFEMKILPWHLFYDLEIPYVKILIILLKILWAYLGIIIIENIRQFKFSRKYKQLK